MVTVRFTVAGATSFRGDYKHALAIGKIAIAWNEYHELLGELFATKSHWETSISLWQCLDSDRTQRKLLRAATETYLQGNKQGQEELRWLLNKTDTILAQQRNVGVQAPLMSLWEIDGSHKILPLAKMGNRNAKQIEGKDILQEYAHYERQIRKMYSFALGLKVKVGNHGTDLDAPWPERPQMIDGIAMASWLRSKVSTHRFSDKVRSLTPYDIHNVQSLARLLLLGRCKQWKRSW